MNFHLSLGFVFLAILAVEARIEFDLYKSEPSIYVPKSHRNKRHIRSLLRGDTPKNDSVSLFKFMNGEYFGFIGVGSPSKTFKVMFDTSWTDTWLPSSHCGITEIVCWTHTRYDSSASSSYIPNDTLVDMGEISGIWSTDTIHLAHLKLPNQTFIEATHIAFNPFIQYKSDGIIGLAYRENSNTGVTPFFYNLIAQGIIVEAVFTFYMNRDETTERGGKIILGGTQRSHVREETLTKLNVVEKKLWKVEVDEIFMRRNKTDFPVSKKCVAIFDSSTNTITGPRADIVKINNMLNAVYIPGINKYAVNCRTYAKLPTISFVFNGNEFVIESKYYIQRMTVAGVEACFTPFVPNDDKTIDYWQLGGAFLMQFYTEFDMNEHVVNIGYTIF